MDFNLLLKKLETIIYKYRTNIVVLCGHLNARHMAWDKTINKKGEVLFKYCTFTLHVNLEVLNTRAIPTYVRAQSSLSVDVHFTNRNYQVYKYEITI